MPPKPKAAPTTHPTETQLAVREAAAVRERIQAQAGKRVDYYLGMVVEAVKLITTDPRTARIRFEEIYQEMVVEKTEDNPKKRVDALLEGADKARVHYSGQVCTVIGRKAMGYAVRIRLLTDTGEIIDKVDPLRVQWVSSLKHPAPNPLPMPEKKKKAAKGIPSAPDVLPESQPPQTGQD
jgi:hypothetical protein